MHALDLDEVERTAAVANQHGTRHVELRLRLPAAGNDRARAGRENLAAFQQLLHGRVMLVLLPRFERLEARIAIVEADDVTDVHAIVIEVIEEAAGIRLAVDRPAERVLDATGLHS